MKEIVLLDSGPLSKYSNPKSGKNNDLCKQRVNDLLAKGVEVKVPEVADYELRRQLKLNKLLTQNTKGLERLDAVIRALGLVTLTSRAIDMATDLWAAVRKKQGKSDEGIDADVLIAAQAILEAEHGDSVKVATTNKKHFDGIVPFLDWTNLGK
jgi:predicted nucleic acid-binding protein